MSHFSKNFRGTAVPAYMLQNDLVAVMSRDGYIPPRRKSKSAKFPFRELFALLSVFCLLRVLVAASMGVAAYGAKLDALARGTSMEWAASVLMHLDPVSEAAARGMRLVFAAIGA
ncbi:MAG: hypothetical protein AAF748_14305 [Pseudomonadota bacterium]